ncbi:class I SAM-dependent methyltransferase [Pyxidicoccus parkwayensis]|jgi:2-polyprenyl-3-methyl-5-hydroxy-6-metoxy-1,4-benzoquinol methylase|uniref:Class I SAM-dependent methyltransferase n=1 Tax=Pyxidicoccus parkwayensis TaxID=2813578 RepID=A0ABX7P4Y0_9BACT|nr:class I SAM-dependent methyltransferase [Pyxidicoccus parkwaysis]QSQ25506.1 class I SAM-dependent methyltransferase [Pyxidicoccus parkwaysis]
MAITMSPHEYATAFRLLAASARHPENIERAVAERVLSHLPKQPTLLDVGAGNGKVAERLAPHFSALTLLEPNQNQIAGLQLAKAKVLIEPLEHHHSSETYDFVLCSHVMYHVPHADWAGFIDRLLSFVKPGGFCMLVMAAARGPMYTLCIDFSETLLFSEQVAATVKQMRLPHEVLPTMAGFVAQTFEEMFTLCRFFVLEGCYTADQLAAMSEDEVRTLDAKIRTHAERCRGPDGVYRLGQDEDFILIRKS